MRLLFINIILTFYAPFAMGQSKNSQTEIIIIGTIHTGNKSFNQKTLFDLLKLYSPDIILREQSIKFKRVFGLATANFLNIWKPSIEQLALQKYSRFYKNIQIFPFDTTIPSRRNYIKNLLAVKHSYYGRLSSIKKSDSDSIIFADFDYKRNAYHNLLDTATLTRINQRDITGKIREL